LGAGSVAGSSEASPTAFLPPLPLALLPLALLALALLDFLAFGFSAFFFEKILNIVSDFGACQRRRHCGEYPRL
jgi:hypothetical protein